MRHFGSPGLYMSHIALPCLTSSRRAKKESLRTAAASRLTRSTVSSGVEMEEERTPPSKSAEKELSPENAK